MGDLGFAGWLQQESLVSRGDGLTYLPDEFFIVGVVGFHHGVIEFLVINFKIIVDLAQIMPVTELHELGSSDVGANDKVAEQDSDERGNCRAGNMKEDTAVVIETDDDEHELET